MSADITVAWLCIAGSLAVVCAVAVAIWVREDRRNRIVAAKWRARMEAMTPQERADGYARMMAAVLEDEPIPYVPTDTPVFDAVKRKHDVQFMVDAIEELQALGCDLTESGEAS